MHYCRLFLKAGRVRSSGHQRVHPGVFWRLPAGCLDVNLDNAGALRPFCKALRDGYFQFCSFQFRPNRGHDPAFPVQKLRADANVTLTSGDHPGDAPFALRPAQAGTTKCGARSIKCLGPRRGAANTCARGLVMR